MGLLSNYIEGPGSGSKWGDGLTFEYGLTIKDIRYTHSGAYPDIFERGFQLI